MAWPSRARWRAYGVFLAVFCLLFFPLYFAAGEISAWSGRAREMFLPWETQIPLIPWMILPYFSLYTAFVLPLAHLSVDETARLTRQSIVALAVAFGVFLLFPGKPGFVPEHVTGPFASAFELIGLVDTPHNLVPSLHVAFAALILCGCADRVPPWLRRLYLTWLAILMASTVLVHQHHLLDVATGLGLAVLVRWLMPLDAGRQTSQ